MVHTLFLVAAILLGVCVGSFLNVVIFRIPAGTFFKGGHRSHCPKCGGSIAWFDNLPIVSWLFLLRGKARCCGNSISVRYPLVEALTAATLGGLFLWCFPTEASLIETELWLLFGFGAWFLAVLIACTFIDIDHRILPDVLTKPTMVVGLVGAAAVPLYPLNPPDWFGSLLQGLLGMGAGLALTATVRSTATYLFRKEAMGFGDVKFMGAIGAFVGWDGAVLTFFLGSTLGAVYGVIHQWITKEGQVFFGPFLAAGAVMTFFFRPEIVNFITVTWPAWQAKQQLSPVILLAIAVGCLVCLFLLIRRARRN